MGWHGHLKLDYQHDAAAGRTGAHDQHIGPLRVLQRLYPEGQAVCHHVLVHPPGGIVGGDSLELDITMQPGSHALITTPGATRFYRSAGELATQAVRATLNEGTRLEWLPLETLVYDAALAENRLQFDLAPSAEMMGWDLLGLGLPAAERPFTRGHFTQHLELPGRWLERGRIAGQDLALLNSPLGLAGHSVMATLWFASGSAMPTTRREALLEAARAICDADTQLKPSAGCTAPEDGIIVLRCLSHRVEPAMALLQRVWAAWRQAAWGLPACAPRVWRT